MLDELKNISVVKNKKPFSPSYFPREGLSIRFILNNFASLQLNDMYNIEELIERVTRPFQCSFIELLGATNVHNHEINSEADFFISFAYCTKLKDFLSALEVLSESTGTTDTTVWISLFSLNQHHFKTPPNGWYTRTYITNIQQFDHAILILDSVKHPRVYMRLWCIVELFAVISTGTDSLGIVCSKRHSEVLIDMVVENVHQVHQALCNIQVEGSYISGDGPMEEFSNYLESVDLPLGYVNKRLRSFLEFWLARKLQELVNSDANPFARDEFVNTRIQVYEEIGRIFKDYGQILDAKSAFKKALFNRVSYNFTECEGGAMLYLDLGAIYQYQNRLHEAQTLYRKALGIGKKLLGVDHRITLKAQTSIGVVLKLQEMYDDAANVLRDVLTKRRRALGNHAQEVAMDLKELASVLIGQKKLEEAELLLEEALEIAKEKLEKGHPHKAEIYNDLATTFALQGKYDEAAQYFQKALRNYTVALGKDHVYTAIALENLGTTLSEKGDFAEAEAKLRKSLELFILNYGDKHKAVAQSYLNLADNYRRQKKPRRAKKMWQKALRINEQVFGTQHEEYLKCKRWWDK